MSERHIQLPDRMISIPPLITSVPFRWSFLIARTIDEGNYITSG
uniref:Uncharacterized protein n=1 Tax=Arundo donax TaxID=35708 RepID=A0A0A8ZAL6_ARUDO